MIGDADQELADRIEREWYSSPLAAEVIVPFHEIRELRRLHGPRARFRPIIPRPPAEPIQLPKLIKNPKSKRVKQAAVAAKGPHAQRFDKLEPFRPLSRPPAVSMPFERVPIDPERVKERAGKEGIGE